MSGEVFILDSNIWISYIITKQLHKLVSKINDNFLAVLTSYYLVKEIRDVLARPKFKKYIKLSDIEEVISLHLKLCRYVQTEDTLKNLTDPKDNFLISLYYKGGATILVSGDKELLKEAGELNCRVMTMREFELFPGKYE
jgi:putative PIN family toxin of toxin-antitoxin system